MSNVVLFQKSWEEKKSKEKENPLSVSLCSSAHVRWVDSPLHDLLLSGKEEWFWRHSRRGNADCQCHHDYQQIWDICGGKEEKQQEQRGVYPQHEGAANKCQKSQVNFFHPPRGPGVGGKLMEMSLLRPTEQGTKGTKGYNHFFCVLNFCFGSLSYSQSLAPSWGRLGIGTRGPPTFRGNFIWATEIFPRRPHLL